MEFANIFAGQDPTLCGRIREKEIHSDFVARMEQFSEPEIPKGLWIELEDGEKVSVMIDDAGDFFEVDEDGKKVTMIQFHQHPEDWKAEPKQAYAEALAEEPNFWDDLIGQLSEEYAEQAEDEILMQHGNISQVANISSVSPELAEELYGSEKIVTFEDV